MDKKLKYVLEKNEVFRTYLIKKEGILCLPSNLQNYEKGSRQPIRLTGGALPKSNLIDISGIEVHLALDKRNRDGWYCAPTAVRIPERNKKSFFKNGFRIRNRYNMKRQDGKATTHGWA